MEIVELRDLRLAVVASQHRSLRKAAEAIGIRQSTLSRRLRDLECRLGVVLFERTNGGTRPTDAGPEFMETARRIIDDVDAALRRLKTRKDGEIGQLRIGVYASLSTANLHATLVEQHRRFPEVELYIIDGDHDRLMCALTANRVDVAIMTIIVKDGMIERCRYGVSAYYSPCPSITRLLPMERSAGENSQMSECSCRSKASRRNSKR